MASSDPKGGGGPGSTLMCDLVASCYHMHVKRHCRGCLLDLGGGKVRFYALYRDTFLKPSA
jgi:hypothetical protein